MLCSRTAVFFGLLVLASGVASADTLTLYFFPSPFGIDWSSPRMLLASTLVNTLSGDSHTIGHVEVRLECAETGNLPAVHELTGATGATDEEVKTVLLDDQEGLGLLFHTFSGHLDEAADVEAQLQDRYRDGTTSIFEIDIGSSVCRRLSEYLNEYRARGYDKLYGLVNQPREGQGAGCSAFGESFLEVAGLAEPVMRANWSDTVLVPQNLVGGEMTGFQVPLVDILGYEGRRWAREGEPGFPVFFWSPDRMDEWIQELWYHGANPPSLPYERFEVDHAVGIRLHAESLPAPTGPIWLN